MAKVAEQRPSPTWWVWVVFPGFDPARHLDGLSEKAMGPYLTAQNAKRRARTLSGHFAARIEGVESGKRVELGGVSATTRVAARLKADGVYS